MNMDMNKKMLPIIIGVLILIVFIILIIIVVLSNGPDKKIVVNSNDIDNAQSKEENEIEEPEQNQIKNNTVKNEIEEKPIEGEISYVETEDGTKIPVPPTFKFVEGEANSGAVIADEKGNEFVWVPVGDFNNYQRQMFLHNGEGGETTSTLEDENIRDINSYNNDFDDSIRNYGGFYIARYEAGKDDDGELVSQKGKLVWTGINWQKAREISIEMYDENDFFQTDLINSYAWDTTCNWLRNYGINIDDSTDFGNYHNNINYQNKIVLTGSNERWKTNNIYDMGGNAWEFTTEEYGEHEKFHMGRGGGYWNEGTDYPISSRARSEDTANLAIGFRVVMYLK